MKEAIAMVLSAWCIVPALGALITQQNTTNSRAQRARAGNFAVAVVICVLLLSAVATAQTWTEKRAKLPPATTATGTYTPANVVPMANTAGTQQVLFYNPVDQM